MNCPNCHSTKTEFDKTYGFHKCLDCLHIWAEDKDDPDYEELDNLLEDSPVQKLLSSQEIRQMNPFKE